MVDSHTPKICDSDFHDPSSSSSSIPAHHIKRPSILRRGELPCGAIDENFSPSLSVYTVTGHLGDVLLILICRKKRSSFVFAATYILDSSFTAAICHSDRESKDFFFSNWFFDIIWKLSGNSPPPVRTPYQLPFSLFLSSPKNQKRKKTRLNKFRSYRECVVFKTFFKEKNLFLLPQNVLF